jgi:pimeloyl-ACP methyl ester carboxylesterase
MQTSHLTVNDLTIPYIITGKGEPVVFVHGALSDHRMWIPHCEYLSADYQAIALTQRYFGQPPLTDDPHQFGISIHYNDLITFIEQLGLEPVHLVGWSYGADIVLNMAVNRPDLLRSVFLYEPGFPSYVENEQALEQFGQDAEAMFSPVFAAVANGNLRVAVEQLLDGSGQRQGYFEAQPELIKQQQLENAHTLPLQLSQLAPPILSTVELREVVLPVCVAVGERTRPLFSIVAAAAAQSLPNSECITIADRGHLFPIEEPNQFVLQLLAFLNKDKG